ncbi:MAG TPA: DNA polymerase III subunit gamma/tau [Thermoanaerobaculia bacterium]|nr:DNA polymerase III subunit gamma/tau [Thermoanaerobaculia bacterium]
MTYQALARKWRPQDFSSLIGQDPVVTALRNALVDRRIAQAYLFAGIRGVGKTTAARVLAKALNCERGPAADPCNECTPCLEITRGSDLDVQEIDAATYSKVEQVRELTESLKYGPARDRYKVVVLDEVHRLSRQAFDALLKIVEEPPPHLVFIFATTELEAVPVTILSRCQEYRFRRVPAPLLASHLATVCAAEGIEASETALRLIARAGEGSVRDAVALLDQLATYGAGSIADEDAARLLGSFDGELLHRLLGSMLGGDAGAVAVALGELELEGQDPRQLFVRLLGYCRDGLHLAMGVATDAVELPIEEAQRLQATARQSGYENLLRLLHQLLASEAVVRRSEQAWLALEVALLRAAELPKLVRVEELLAGGRAVAAAPPAQRQEGRGAGGAAAAPPAPATATAAPPTAAQPAPGPPPPPPGVEALVQAVNRRRQVLAAHLRAAEALRFADGTLLIVQPPGDRWLEGALTRDANRAALEQSLAEVWGAGTGWRLLPGEGTPAAAAAGEEQAAAAAAADPTVQKVLQIFDGRIQAVERQEDPES